MTKSGIRPRVGDRGVVFAYRLGYALVSRLPARVAHLIGGGVGFIVALLMPKKRRMLERHLRRVNPEVGSKALRATSRKAIVSYVRYYIESFRLPRLSAATVAAGFDKEGFDHIQLALEKGKGVILALPHLGGWEWAGRWLTDQGHKMTVVVEPLNPPELFEWFAGLRSDLGMTVVPLGPNVAAEISAALKRNEVVCLLCDRDIQRTGVAVTMFGEETTLPGGPALLSIRSGAALIPAAVYFDGKVDGHWAIVRPPLQIERGESLRDDTMRLTQLLAGELEFLIRRAPEQWHLLQPNWPSDPGYQVPSTR